MCVLLSPFVFTIAVDPCAIPHTRNCDLLFFLPLPTTGLLRNQESISQIIACSTEIGTRAYSSGDETGTGSGLAQLATLQIAVLGKLLAHLAPRLHWLSEAQCIEKITGANGTMVGLLPVPHPILIRSFQSNSQTTEWFSTFIWSVIFIRRADLFDASAIVLFQVKTVDDDDLEE